MHILRVKKVLQQESTGIRTSKMEHQKRSNETDKINAAMEN